VSVSSLSRGLGKVKNSWDSGSRRVTEKSQMFKVGRKEKDGIRKL
jgi:hypothetical protein